MSQHMLIVGDVRKSTGDAISSQYVDMHLGIMVELLRNMACFEAVRCSKLILT